MKILCSNKIYEFAEKRIFPDQVVFNGVSSCIIPYVNPGIELKKTIELEISKWIKNYGQLPKLILLKNHGIITFGKTVDECIIKTEICEKSAEIFSGALIHGIEFLTNNEVTELLNDEKEKYRINQL
jgi:ribulose-5-phosphate 4-epimerase/fuculose-1-phosphate aldolase